jgi:hypothetical protein
MVPKAGQEEGTFSDVMVFGLIAEKIGKLRSGQLSNNGNNVSQKLQFN